jgi:predicted PilT family ATPase
MVNEISVNDHKLEVVTSFEYLGSLITNNGDTIKEIKRRTSIALQILKQLKKL